MRGNIAVKWSVAIGLFLASVVGIGAFYGSDGGSATNGPSPHATLQVDADMIQQMSAPNADTGAPVHGGEGQLQRSQSQGYLRSLEQHQADVDRMLGRGTP